MRLHVLGHTAPFPAVGRACPGYLVEHGATRLLLDAGSGTLERMLAVVGYEDLTAVVVSHLHFDHASDLYVLRYAIDACRKLGRRTEPLPIYLPAEPPELVGWLNYRDATCGHVVRPGEVLGIGPLRLSFHAVEHSLPTHAVTVEAQGRRLAYSGDCRRCQGLEEAAAGADLLLCEATFQEQDRELAEPTGHLTAAQAARAAAEAGARRLVLTHIQAMYDRTVSLEEARSAAAVAVELAEEGQVYEV